MGKKFQLEPEWTNYTRKQIAKVAKRIFENANRRLRNIGKNQLLSPAYEAAMSSGGEFHVKGKSAEDILRELFRAVNFLNADTSTVLSARKYTKAVENASPNLTENEVKAKWEIYSKLQQMYPAYFAAKSTRKYRDSDRIIKEIEERILEKRRSVYGGIGGDMVGFSMPKIDILSSANAQARAYAEILESVKRSIEDRMNNFIDSYDGKNLSFGFIRIKVD